MPFVVETPAGLRTDLTLEEVRPKLRELVDRLFEQVPSGVGRSGFIKLTVNGLKPCQ